MIIVVNVIDAAGLPVQNMGVQIYNEANTALLDTQYTDVLGDANFDELAGRYQLRFYGEHILASVTSPQQINVQTPPPANAWQFTAATFVVPIAPNPNMCRCWAFFRTASGHPLADQYIRIAPKMDPVGMYPALSVGLGQQPEQLITDSLGYAQIDLPRAGKFDITMEGYLDCSFEIEVPNANTQNLVDLLLPTPRTVVFNPAAAIGVGVGGVSAPVTYVVTMSDGTVLTGATTPTAQEYVEIESLDETVATVSSNGSDSFTVSGVGLGATTVTAIPRVGAVFPRVPAVVPTVTPIAVTVP